MNTVVPMETMQIDTYLRILHGDPNFVNMGIYILVGKIQLSYREHLLHGPLE
ncbi:hypothetical protein ACS0TY_028742 [Phlomoides rotata]